MIIYLVDWYRSSCSLRSRVCFELNFWIWLLWSFWVWRKKPNSVALIWFKFLEFITAMNSFYTLSAAHLQSRCTGQHSKEKFQLIYEDAQLWPLEFSIRSFGCWFDNLHLCTRALSTSSTKYLWNAWQCRLAILVFSRELICPVQVYLHIPKIISFQLATQSAKHQIVQLTFLFFS